MSSYNEPIISMQELIYMLSLKYDVTKYSVRCDCPFCGGKKAFKLNYENNSFRCYACNEGGGVYDFWAMHRGIDDPIPEKRRYNAVMDIKSFKGDIKNNKIVAKAKKIKPPELNYHQQLPTQYAHETFGALFNQLSLSKKHIESLKKRGFSEKQVLINGYKTYPKIDLKGIANNLQRQGLTLKGIPGFHKTKDGVWTLMWQQEGILIPVKNALGQIQALQIRYDNPSDGIRYKTISSQYEIEGTKGVSKIHFNPGNGNMRSLILTEGVFKGDLISYFTGYCTLSILGVNSTKDLISIITQLKDHGLKYIYIAFDMDFATNENVQRALNELKLKIAYTNTPFKTIKWDDSYKGLDDFYNYHLNNDKNKYKVGA